MELVPENEEATQHNPPKKQQQQFSYEPGVEMPDFSNMISIKNEDTDTAISTTITSNASISFASDEEFFSPPTSTFTFEMNQKHQMILDHIREGDEWHQNLQHVYGFTEAESCECFSRAGKYLHCNEFPEDAVNQKLFPHAKKGWVLLREADRLGKTYPRELMELDRRARAEGKGPGVFWTGMLPPADL